ncbi:MAG: hypothetical protein GY796_13360 [Chloroflexi bacterium]|nr:hypothetical protein [Chloroflexota bacterium]
MLNRYNFGQLPFAFIFLGILLWFQSVHGQGGQFTAEAIYTFGGEIHFDLTAVTNEPIETATIFLQKPNVAAPSYAPANLLQMADGTVTAEYKVAAQAIQLPPFADVTYWWVLETVAGDQIETPPQTLSYQDGRFGWHTLLVREDEAAIRWPGDETEVGLVAQQTVAATRQQIANLLPLPTDRFPDIVLYPSLADLRSALRLNGHDWVNGRADPALGLVLSTAVNDRTAVNDLPRSLPPELFYFWLYQTAGETTHTIPPWFSEGIAQQLNGAFSPSEMEMLQTAVTHNNTVPLADLCAQFPANNSALARVQSESLTRYVQANYGDDALPGLLVDFLAGEDCNTAVQHTLKTTPSQLEQDWLDANRPQPAPIRFLQENGLYLLLLLVGFVIMGLLIRWPKPI